MASRTLLALTLTLGMAAHLAAQGAPGSLGAASELYVAERYEEALELLKGLRSAEAGSVSERRAVEQYRSLCLLALGRTAEAEQAIAAVITADPMYQPTEAETSPRVRAAFTEVRQRVLPGIALSHYTAAKRLYDARKYESARAAFRGVLRLLDDPDMSGRYADLRVLASGFLELSAAAAAPPAEPAAEGPPAPPAAVTPAATENRIYSAENPDVSPAVAIKQDLPRVPASISALVRDRGVVEVVIDELGRVTVITIRASLHPMYDTLLLSAAREWRYQPATLGGAPVKFRKTIQIVLSKR